MCVKGRENIRAIQSDNVSRVNWFAQKQLNELDFKVVCEDEFSNHDKSYMCDCLSINDKEHCICLIVYAI